MKNLPPSFSRFAPILDIFTSNEPSGVAFVGSYGDPGKDPDCFSDIDIVFVFDRFPITAILKRILGQLTKIAGLESAHLGVHYQFGHVISMYFNDDPMRWVDVGIMDSIFAKNYLVNHPITVVSGSVPTCGLAQNPINQMRHLAKKIIQAQHRRNVQAIAICCYRYLGWWKVNFELVKRLSIQCSNEVNKLNPLMHATVIGSEIGHFYGKYNFSLQTKEIVEVVLKDIKRRFPDIFQASP